MDMDKFLTSNDAKYRLLRTILQGIIGVIIAQLPAVLGNYQLDPVWSATIVALVMAILSPIMAMLGEKDEPTEEDV